MSHVIKKLLVANRGEIAVRIMHTAREMGIATVAVFSEADRQALHVQVADEAVLIGPAASSESYLVVEKIIEAALATGAQAIHPGYGFLSENAAFAQAVADAGLIWVGPSPASIALMGSKLGAKEAVQKYGIPLVPGTPGAIAQVDEALKVAEEIGYPVLIKASAGGGGKGMRLVHHPQELPEQMERAISEAQSAFGDGAVFIEKYIMNPKHIEVQVLADAHGQVLHLWERECSVQRRHQKVVEEAPCATLRPQVRQAMGQAAVQVAQACNYTGAGTVEFVMDKDQNFYFLEMNTRLQVEHPVTELITGLDLVREQLRIAAGEPLGYTQQQVAMQGHAIEVRVYAENPEEGFLPSTGTLHQWVLPQGPGIRVDTGYRPGDEVPVYYDPLLAKLVVHAADRPAAIARMQRAIAAFGVAGVSTTLGFCQFVMRHPAFVDGSFDTGFVATHYQPDLLATQPLAQDELALLAIAATQHAMQAPQAAPLPQHSSQAWRQRARA